MCHNGTTNDGGAFVHEPQRDMFDLTDRDFLKGIPHGRLGTLGDVVGPVIFLASDAAALVTGVLLPVDGGNLAMTVGGTIPR